MKKARWFILGLTAVICVAVFINWQYVQAEQTNNQNEENKKTLGEESFVKSGDDDTYFDNARFTREQSRNEAISVLKSIVDNENADGNAKLKATEDINEYAVRTEKEASIENQIKAKGYAECIVFLGDDNASVVVQTEGLKTEQAAQIIDLVVSETNLNANVVKIIEMK